MSPTPSIEAIVMNTPKSLVGFRKPSNLKIHNSTLFSAKLHHGCEITSTLESCAYFSLPDKTGKEGDSRRCLLSLLFQFVPGRNSSIGKFSISMDIAKELDDPPVVEGFKFLSLEDTTFTHDFIKASQDGRSQLGREWHDRQYDNIFCGPSDVPYITGQRQTYIWGERRVHPSLTIRGDGFEGAPDCAVQNIPLCILLSFKNPIPPILLADISLRARVTEDANRAFAKVMRSSVVSQHHMQGLRLCNGPEIQVCRGDFTYFQPSISSNSSMKEARCPVRPILTSPNRLRNLFKTKKVNFLDTPDNELPGRNKISKTVDTSSFPARSPSNGRSSRSVHVPDVQKSGASGGTAAHAASNLSVNAMQRDPVASADVRKTAAQSAHQTGITTNSVQPALSTTARKVRPQLSILTDLRPLAPLSGISRHPVTTSGSSNQDLYQGRNKDSTYHRSSNENSSSGVASGTNSLKYEPTTRRNKSAPLNSPHDSHHSVRRKPVPEVHLCEALPSVLNATNSSQAIPTGALPSSAPKGVVVQPLPEQTSLDKVLPASNR